MSTTVSRNTDVSYESGIDPVFHSVRDEDVATWVSIGWIAGGAARMPGWQILVWDSPTMPLAPFSVVRKSDDTGPWFKYLKGRTIDETPTFVYVIREIGGILTKIGVAFDVKTRLAQHQASSNKWLVAKAAWRLPKREAAYDLERLVIDHFEPVRHSGREWLAISHEPVIEFIEEIIRDNDLRSVVRVDPKRAFDAPPEIFERIFAEREAS